MNILEENTTNTSELAMPENVPNELKLAVTVLFDVGIPVISLIGICGNAMAILLIRTNQTLRRLPSNNFLTVLALSSSTFLLTMCIGWMEQLIGKSLSKEYGCKVLTYLAHWSDLVCVWLIVIVCLERLILLTNHRFRARCCSIAGSKRIIICLILVAAVLNVWVLVVNFANQDAEGAMFCDVSDEVLYTVFMSIDTAICIAIPAVAISLINALVIVRLRYFSQFLPSSPCVRFQRLSKDATKETLDQCQDRVCQDEGGGVTLITISSTSSSSSRRCIRPADLRLTKTLLVLTSLFIILQVPSYIYRFLHAFVWGEESEEMTKHPVDILLKIIAILMYYSHHAVLFYVYIFYSPTMKKQLKPTALKLLECYCLKPVPECGFDYKLSY